MSLDLKEKILDLLERDREFRYAVAGLIGLDEILKRLDEHDRKFNEILTVLKEHTAILKEHTTRLDEHDRKFNEILATLKEHTAILKEYAARLNEHDRKFNEILAKLSEHDRKFNKIVSRLDGHDRKFNEIISRLDEHDRKFNEIVARLDAHDRKFNEIVSRLDEHDRKFNSIIAEIRDIRKELVDVKSYMERFSLTLEEEAWEVITSRLRRIGVDVKLARLTLPELEINIYGVAGDLCVVGEASTRVGVGVLRSVDEKLTELRRRYPEYLRRRVLKVVYTMWATEDAVEEAKKRNIWLLKGLEDLTQPNI